MTRFETSTRGAAVISLALLAAAVAGGCGKGEATSPPAAVAPAPSEPAAAPSEPTAAPSEPAAAPSEPSARAEIGKPAPDFTLPDADGGTFKLSDQRGKLVVIEWFNPGCPFVRYAYGEGPLKGLAAQTVRDDLVWVQVNSGAPGKQGHGVEQNKVARDEWKLPRAVLLDEDGAVGRAYQAKTTPHIFIVSKTGDLLYMGGLDNAPLGEAHGETPTNYVTMALADIEAGRPVAVPETKAYGCSVKY